MNHTGKVHSFISPPSGLQLQLLHLCEFLFCAHVKKPKSLKPPQTKSLGQASEILYKKIETASLLCLLSVTTCLAAFSQDCRAHALLLA